MFEEKWRCFYILLKLTGISGICRHLEENQISVIERGAFQDLKQLERL